MPLPIRWALRQKRFGHLPKRAATRSGFADADMEFLLMRALGVAYYGGGTMGELFLAAEQTRELMAANPDRVVARLLETLVRSTASVHGDHAIYPLLDSRS